MDQKITVLLLLVLASAIYVYQPQAETLTVYRSYLSTYGKAAPKDSELLYRVSVFEANLQTIRKHNSNPDSTWQMGMNQFTDFTQEEFIAIFLGEKQNDYMPPAVELPINVGFAGQIDWRTKNIVTAIKNQGQCGSCWAFAATAAHQSYQVQVKKQPITISLSEQQLVDCSRDSPYENNGCGGGYGVRALEYIKDNGQTTTDKYPYVARDQDCAFSTGTYRTFGVAEGHGCDEIEQILGRNPMAVRVDASNWHLYKSGVFNSCAKALNHAVFLVGSSETAWTIKNSWGNLWGEQGYIRLAKGDTCGVCTGPSFPI